MPTGREAEPELPLDDQARRHSKAPCEFRPSPASEAPEGFEVGGAEGRGRRATGQRPLIPENETRLAKVRTLLGGRSNLRSWRNLGFGGSGG